MGDESTDDAYAEFYTPDALRLFGMGDFMDMKFPVREMMLGPVLPAQGLAMVYAPRGLGKTFFALGFAHAVSCGGSFLRWKAPKPRRVLYVDGEMPAVAMQERLQLILYGSDIPMMDLNRVSIISADLQGDITIDVSTAKGQALVEAYVDDVDMIVLDNLASLHLGAENEGDDWKKMQAWLLSLRRRGKSVLLVHHSGKTGQQRGTSRREDILDTVIALRRPSDYAPEQGARFEVHLEKARGIYGDDTLPFEAQLNTGTGGARWSTKPLEDVERGKVVDMARQGLTVREIAEETGISKSKVGRIRKAAEQEGLLDEEEAEDTSPNHASPNDTSHCPDA